MQHVQPFYGGANAGGLVGCVRLIPVRNLASPPVVQAGQVVGELSLVRPDDYCDVWFTPGTGQFVEESDFTDQGQLYKQKLTLEVPRNAPDVAQGIAQVLALRDFVALCQDGNACTYLLGSAAWPLRPARTLSTGQRTPDGNRLTLQLSSETPIPAAFYGHLELAAGARRVFSNGFSFGFLRTP